MERETYAENGRPSFEIWLRELSVLTGRDESGETKWSSLYDGYYSPAEALRAIAKPEDRP